MKKLTTIIIYLTVYFVQSNSQSEEKSDGLNHYIHLDSLIQQLSSDEWDNALTQLNEYVEREDVATNKKAQTLLSLGEFWAGLLPLPPSKSPPDVNLREAFKYFLKAAEYPIPGVERAQYAISWIANYHPEMVTENFKPKFKTLPSGKESATNQLVTKQEQPNIPLIFTHQSSSSSAHYLPSMMSLANKFNYGHYTSPNCDKAAELYKEVAQSAIQNIKYKPQVKLSSESIILEEEFTSGKTSIEDEKDIIQYYIFSADKGNVGHQVALGILYLDGIGGLAKDYDKAFQYIKKAAELGDPAGTTHLAYMYQNGLGTKVDNNTAISLLNRAASLGSSTALAQLGVLYYHGWSVKQSYEQAKTNFEIAAQNKEPTALLYLGKMASKLKSRDYYSLSAQAGNIIALYELGINSKEGITPSCSNAVQYFKKVLERTVLKNKTYEAYKLYSMGYYDRALVNYIIAADQGDPLAQYNAAWMYEMGIGTETLGGFNYPKITIDTRRFKALQLYIRAAQQSTAGAHLKLGDYYYYGWGVAPNPSLAAIYYNKASENRNAQATFNLGYMHHKGIGLEKDLYLAKRFYDLAAELSEDAYIPTRLALGYLSLDFLLENGLGDMNLGVETDTAAIVILTIILFISLLIRYWLE